jgi:hypothetical protein
MTAPESPGVVETGKINSTKPTKRVTVAVKMDSHFVALLSAHVQLAYPGALTGDRDRRLTPGGVLAVAILAEARGALPEQVHMAIPPEWRPHFEVLHDARRVEE